MNESSDDIMIKDIKEILEQYEPEYSPLFWERIREQRPVPELRLITFLLKFKYWFSVLIISGGLFIVYLFTNVLPPETAPVADPAHFDSAVYLISSMPGKRTYSGDLSSSGVAISNIENREEENNRSARITKIQRTEDISADDQDYTKTENATSELPYPDEKDPGIQLLPLRIGFIFKPNIPGLIPYLPEDTRPLRVKSSESKSKNSRKIVFHWPDFSAPVKKDGYDKFIGPNKFALFYSPEIQFSDSLGKIGVSQGIGINIEGPLRSLISVSAGLSYQSVTFSNKIAFSGIIPPDGPFQPSDTNMTFFYIDSVEIRSGSYKFLEIPVSVNYKFIESPKSQVWVGAGISSIAFLEQNYTYETQVGEVSDSSGISVKAWENIHPLASLNFSLFYRYNLGYRSLLHGAVQYKQHLVPLGQNPMKLNRLNFQVGIIYRFGRED